MDLKLVGVAIEGTRQSLDAAGYSIDCRNQENRLILVVKPRENACEDCLVPKEVMASIVDGELREKGIAVGGIDIIYPADL
jgi:hypothetical protein